MMFPRFARRLLTLATILVALTAAAPYAAAQEAPLRLVFLNADDKGAKAAYTSIHDVLETSNDLVLTDDDTLLDAARKRDLSRETFRKGSLREQHVDDFAEIMREIDVEGVLVMDVFGGGNTLQLIVLGPRGQELADVRESIRGGQVDQATAVSALKQVFTSLVPEVRTFREEQAAAEPEPDLMAEPEPAEPAEASLKAAAVAEHRRSFGNLERHFTPSVGAMFGRRSLQLETEADYNLNHETPFVGVHAQVGSILSVLSADKAAIGVLLFGSYAPFTTLFTSDAGQVLELPSSFAHAGVDLRYLMGLSPRFLFFANLGAEYLSVSINQNSYYTGSQYIDLRAGGGLVYRFGELADLTLEALALPVLSAALSADAMGPSEFGVGWGGRAALEFRLLEPLKILVGYELHYYPVSFPEPNPEVVAEPVTITDLFHLVSATVGYSF